MNVTMIVPVYNAEKHLKRCLDSLIKQNFEGYEILLIDDGSQDNSLAIVKEYSQKYSNISFIAKQNEGVAKTRNLGIEQAKGKFVMFVDNDDFVEPDYISTYFSLIEKNNCDVVCGGYRRVTDQEVLFESSKKVSDWFKYTVTAPWAKIYNRKFLLENNFVFLDYPIGEDIYFNLQVFVKSSKVYTTNYIGYNWYFNKSSISNTSQKGFNNEVDILVLLDKIYDKIGKENEYVEYFYYRYVIWYLLFSGRNSESKVFVAEYKRYFEWLNKKNIRKRFFAFSRMLAGETLVNRCSIGFFNFLAKTRLIKVVFKNIL